MFRGLSIVTQAILWLATLIFRYVTNLNRLCSANCRITTSGMLFTCKWIGYDLTVFNKIYWTDGPTFVGYSASSDGTVCPEVEMSDVTSDRWLSVDDIAAYLGVKRYTIYKWIERKNMPAHKVGSLWKFKLDEIDDWVRTGEAGESYESRKPR